MFNICIHVICFKMSEEEQSKNILLKEAHKWKKIEEYVLLTISKYKNDCKREEELNKSLENKIEYLNKSNCDLTEEIKSEVYNKYFSTHDLFKLGGLSDQINDSCDDVKKLLETCNKLQEKYKSSLEKVKNKILNRKNVNQDLLRSQSNDMINIQKNTKNYNEKLITEKEKKIFELHNLKQLQDEMEINLKLLLESNEHLHQKNIKYENEIKDLEKDKNKVSNAINKRNQLKETALVAISDLEMKTNQEIKILTETSDATLRKYEDINLNIEEWKISTGKQESSNEDLIKENMELEFDSKSQLKKLSELEQCTITEENNYLQNCKDLKDYVKSFSENIQNKKEILLIEKETENIYTCDTENFKNNLEGKINNVKNLKINLDKLCTKKNNLLEDIDNEKQSTEIFFKICEKNNEHINNLKFDLQELNTTTSNFKLEYEDNIANLIKEIEIFKFNVDMKKKELEAIKLKYRAETDKARSDGIMNFNNEIQKFENDLDDMKKMNEKKNDEMKQISINLESKTLECDILIRKIKTAEGVKNSLEEELKPKPIINKLIFHKKRHVDDTSESSFDGNISFHQRMLLKKKLKKGKTSP